MEWGWWGGGGGWWGWGWRFGVGGMCSAVARDGCLGVYERTDVEGVKTGR